MPRHSRALERSGLSGTRECAFLWQSSSGPPQRTRSSSSLDLVSSAPVAVAASSRRQVFSSFLTVNSPDVGPGSYLPDECYHTCVKGGRGQLPDLSISEPPKDTRAYVLAAFDDDGKALSNGQPTPLFVRINIDPAQSPPNHTSGSEAAVAGWRPNTGPPVCEEVLVYPPEGMQGPAHKRFGSQGRPYTGPCDLKDHQWQGFGKDLASDTKNEMGVSVPKDNFIHRIFWRAYALADKVPIHIALNGWNGNPSKPTEKGVYDFLNGEHLMNPLDSDKGSDASNGDFLTLAVRKGERWRQSCNPMETIPEESGLESEA